MFLAVGTRIGPYEITGTLGAGGMGEVYRARDARLARDVALKVLPDSFAGDSERVVRFHREAQVLAALKPRSRPGQGADLMMQLRTGAFISSTPTCQSTRSVTPLTSIWSNTGMRNYGGWCQSTEPPAMRIDAAVRCAPPQ
jgi:serine/threonine protein kinase